jgi:hypothetical protein
MQNAINTDAPKYGVTTGPEIVGQLASLRPVGDIR